MTNTYEGMFLLDNRVVRENWKVAKAIVTDVLEKHGGKVITARRWDERQLAYPIKKRNRATFLLAHYEIDSEGIKTLRRDLDLSEQILRYLLLRVDLVPEDEFKLSDDEQAEDFSVPTPPEDHIKDEVPEEESDERRPRRRFESTEEATPETATAEKGTPEKGTTEDAPEASPEGESAVKEEGAEEAKTTQES